MNKDNVTPLHSVPPVVGATPEVQRALSDLTTLFEDERVVMLAAVGITADGDIVDGYVGEGNLALLAGGMSILQSRIVSECE